MVGNWAKCLGQSLRTWVIQVEKKGGSQSQSNLDIVSWKCLRLLETIKSELTADVVEIRDKHESFHFKKFQPTTSPDRILRRLVCHMGNSLTNWSLRSHTLSHLWNSKSTFLCFNSLHQIWIALFPSGASLLANAQKFPASHGITSSADLGFFKSKEFKFSPWDVFDCGRKTHFILEDQGLPESPWPFARVEDPLFSLFPNRRRPASEFLLIRWFVQLIQIQKKRRPSRAKQIQRNARHKLSSNIIKAWNDHSFNLECPSSDLGFWVFFYPDFKETATWFQRSPKLLVLPGSERIAPKGSVTNCIRNTWFIGL